MFRGRSHNSVGRGAGLVTDYCVLSVEEAARLEVYSSWPICREHYHVKKRVALEMLTAETHRLVGGADTKVLHPVSMLVPVSLGRQWRPVPTCQLQGFKTWGLAPSR